MVFNNGQAFMAPQWERPRAERDAQSDRNTNRPTEYNSLDDRYPRVIVDALLPVLTIPTSSARARKSPSASSSRTGATTIGGSA